jgi:hypothetical protein
VAGLIRRGSACFCSPRIDCRRICLDRLLEGVVLGLRVAEREFSIDRLDAGEFLRSG